MSIDNNLYREDFPNLKQKIHGRDLVYLDNAATTLKTNTVIQAIHSHYADETSNVHRGIHYLSSKATEKYEQTRKTVQDFVNAKSIKEIIFTSGTTDSINLVAQSFGEKFINSQDEILISTMEHHSNIVPWQIMAKKRGAKVREVPITDAGEIDQAAFEQALSNKVKLVSFSHISNTLGTINPIKEMILKAHSYGARVLIDAAQGAAHLSIDVQDLNCDFLCFSAHKMFGPTGVGVLYGKEDLLSEMPPYRGGGAMIDQVSFEKTTFNELPEKFEAGTPHIAGIIAFNEAIKYIQTIGLDQIEKREADLLNYATSEISKIEGVRIIGTAKNKASVLSFILEGTHPHDIGMILDQQGIAIRTGHHCTQPLMKRFSVPATARASFSFYNNKNDIDRFIKALKKVKEFI